MKIRTVPRLLAGALVGSASLAAIALKLTQDPYVSGAVEFGDLIYLALAWPFELAAQSVLFAFPQQEWIGIAGIAATWVYGFALGIVLYLLVAWAKHGHS